MLLSLTVSNFRSFGREQTLSLIASSRHSEHPKHLLEIPECDNKCLPIIAMYGANGAGKSNTIKALTLLQLLVIEGTEPQNAIPRQAFKLDESIKNSPTEIKIQFHENKTTFEYGFTATSKSVNSEWLSTIKNNKEITLFERLTDEAENVKIVIGKKIAKKQEYKKISSLADVGTHPNQLFLHAILKNIKREDLAPYFRDAISWITSKLTIIGANSDFGDLPGLISTDKSFSEFAGNFLNKVSTGISEITVDKNKVDEKTIDSNKELLKLIDSIPEGESATIYDPEHDVHIFVDKKKNIFIQSISTNHINSEGKNVKFNFKEESDGTKRLTHLLPALHSANESSVFVIDEIDRSLHPLLAKGFARAFLEICTKAQSQLIFTTHDTTFLDLDLLRRDEIWFSNKSSSGETELYSLSDYKIRKDLKIDKGYLEGRFEATPSIEEELPEWVRSIASEIYPKNPKSSDAK